MSAMIGRKLVDDNRGISSVEFSLVAAVFLLIVLSVMDFCLALWEWNAAAYATRVGARYAVVSDIVSLELQALDGTQIGTQIGKPISATKADGTPTIPVKYCTNTGCGDSEAGATDLGDLDTVAFTAIVDRMRQHYSKIAPNNVFIRYEHVGMGMAGNPSGPDLDPMVTVYLRGLKFTMMSPILGLLQSELSLPPFTTTLSGEDGRG